MVASSWQVSKRRNRLGALKAATAAATLSNTPLSQSHMASHQHRSAGLGPARAPVACSLAREPDCSQAVAHRHCSRAAPGTPGSKPGSPRSNPGRIGLAAACIESPAEPPALTQRCTRAAVKRHECGSGRALGSEDGRLARARAFVCLVAPWRPRYTDCWPRYATPLLLRTAGSQGIERSVPRGWLCMQRPGACVLEGSVHMLLRAAPGLLRCSCQRRPLAAKLSAAAAGSHRAWRALR